MARIFEERERAAELLFVRAEEAQFISYCQAVRSLAVYAIDKIGVDGHSAEAYAQELLSGFVQGLRKDALVERVRADLEANGVIVDAADLHRELNRYVAQSVYAETASSRNTVSEVNSVPAFYL